MKGPSFRSVARFVINYLLTKLCNRLLDCEKSSRSVGPTDLRPAGAHTPRRTRAKEARKFQRKGALLSPLPSFVDACNVRLVTPVCGRSWRRCAHVVT